MRVALFLMAWLWMAPAQAATPAQESARIEALIATLGGLDDATFLRNGKAHSATEAASHLRLKWKNAGKRVRTAEDFIRYCATGSSITGRTYRIRFADGRERASADYFRAQLRRIDAQDAPAKATGTRPASSPG
jgi:hypothetical protein